MLNIYTSSAWDGVVNVVYYFPWGYADNFLELPKIKRVVSVNVRKMGLEPGWFYVHLVQRIMDDPWFIKIAKQFIPAALKCLQGEHRLFEIHGEVSVLFSESAEAPTIPAGYRYVKQVGSFKVDSSGDPVPFEVCHISIKSEDARRNYEDRS